MRFKLVIIFIALIAVGGVAVSAKGGIGWLDSLGLFGEERRIRANVENYWKARVEGDLEGMADFVHPLQDQIVQPGLLVTEGFEIHEVRVEDGRVAVDVSVQSRIKHPMFSEKEREVRFEQPWVRYKGKWYVEPQPMGLADSIRKRRGTWDPPHQDAPQSSATEEIGVD